MYTILIYTVLMRSRGAGGARDPGASRQGGAGLPEQAAQEGASGPLAQAGRAGGTFAALAFPHRRHDCRSP